MLYFDKVQLEKVLYNLLSNALKFTPDYGHIQVIVREEQKHVLILVTDTGKGIPVDSRKKLFTNFYQVEENQRTRNIGTGIGLALSKKIANLHHGDVYLEESAFEKQGSCFVLKLKKGRSHFAEEELLKEDSTGIVHYQIPKEEILEIQSEEQDDSHQEPVTILLIEDNKELRTFIKQTLELRYRILEAPNGAIGLDIANTSLPDLIISDVMMPEMDGLELCEKLKTDNRTSHIPVILLTARAGNTHQVSGLKTGADSYLTKPFSVEVLLLKIKNLLALSEKMRKKFSQQMLLEPTNLIIESNDQDFLNKVMKYIEANLDNPEFGVNDLASEVGMSTPILYKKIKALTDQSVNNFIKTVKLKRAAQLLKQGKNTVTEIAYQVGFSGSKYFSKEFAKQFGKSPSEYMEE
jgi:DNA-binding response OmpR family regulator